MPEVESSAIERIEYDPRQEALDVWFSGGRGYRYLAVPPRLYDAFLAAPSKGVFFNRRIRDRYAYREHPARR
jgi:hypothetical protein